MNFEDPSERVVDRDGDAGRMDDPGALAGRVSLTDFLPWLDAWLRSPSMGELAERSGWRVASRRASLGTEALLDEFVRHSDDWNFRGGAERHKLTAQPATVNGHEIDEDVVVACARALGLAADPSPTGRHTHIVVLGGMVRACLNRARLARDLHRRVAPTSTVMLSAYRPLPPVEVDAAVALGWGKLDVERDAMICAAREIFDLSDEPDKQDEGEIDPGPAPRNRQADGTAAADMTVAPAPEADELVRRCRWSRASWTAPVHLEVVAAPSADPHRRRTNSGDQLAFWSEAASISSDDRLLVITTAHYVPYTQLAILRALTVPRGCAVETVGTPWVPSGDYRGAGYLQEIRSTLLAARDLLREPGRTSS